MARRPLTPAEIVDAALELTRERGLEAWSLRDLAAAVGSWPNTITHHVGHREQVVLAVLDRVVGEIPVPPAELAWQDWFRRFLTAGRDVLVRYRGAAWRLCRDGPTVPSALPIIDRATGLLLAAGFDAREAPRAYALLLNSAMMLVALADERAAAGHSREQVSQAMLDMPDPPAAGPGWTAMRGFMAEYVADPTATWADVFAYTVEATIAGLERRIAG